MNLISLLLLILYSIVSFAHGGGLDSAGGHNDRKAGDYRCHREPCLSTHNQTTEAMEEAEGEGVTFPHCTIAMTGITGSMRMVTARTQGVKS